VFRSFPLCLCGAGHRQLGATLNGNHKGRTTLKWVFPLLAVIYLAENLSSPKTFYSLSWFPLLIGNYCVFLRSFPFYFLPIFDPESFFSFSFLSFHFFLFFLFISFSFFFFFRSLIGNSGFSIRYSLSLEEILLSSSSGERMRILFMDQGSR